MNKNKAYFSWLQSLGVAKGGVMLSRFGKHSRQRGQDRRDAHNNKWHGAFGCQSKKKNADNELVTVDRRRFIGNHWLRKA